ncbi:MAG: GMC oxidoreductase [Acidobacteriota bacterium]|nr:GMC oxidoreductase [Acidobacteriota bacterium]
MGDRPERFDVIVIGTGFGGAVAACRLAEAGARTLVLERGRRWTPATYPRTSHDPWLYHARHPEKHHGWLDLRFFRGMAVAQGAGVGGGSLCYSSVVMEADANIFSDPWPPEITSNELSPYYARVARMLRVRPIPDKQRTHRFDLLRRAAKARGWGDRFESVPLAVSFDDEYHYGLPDPIDTKHSKRFTNDQGVEQGTCVHLGNCDIGCDVHAKNTLDLNYIPAAEAKGAQVRPLHLVRSIEPQSPRSPNGSGYRVHWDRIEGGKLVAGSADAERVVVAAGSLGSTELLLRCRDEHGTLPHVSRTLGHGWSGNANFLAPARYPRDVEVNQGIGPTISAGLSFMDGSQGGTRFYVEDDGFPNVLLEAVRSRLSAGGNGFFGRLLAQRLRGELEERLDDGPLQRGFDEKNPTRQLMVWLGEGIDGSDGRLRLRRRWLAPWKKELHLDWDLTASRGVIDALIDVHERLSEVEGGEYRLPLWWRLKKALVTVHPLGGCAMGRSTDDGVVDHRGEVFGHPRLYVSDGAVLPRPTGRNPSMTIGALSERIAHLMTQAS